MTQEWKICREELEFLANTLIFVLSGVIITGKIWESSTTSSLDYIRPADYGYAVLLWVYLLVCDFLEFFAYSHLYAEHKDPSRLQLKSESGDIGGMQLIRGLLFIIFWPFLKRSGYGMTIREAAVLSWYTLLKFQPDLTYNGVTGKVSMPFCPRMHLRLIVVVGAPQVRAAWGCGTVAVPLCAAGSEDIRWPVPHALILPHGSRGLLDHPHSRGHYETPSAGLP